ncbi:MAG: NAD-dependent malic enzyme [Desulfotalea sp.]|nr:MAG: NAD-dependent malic enzyme [Desulfotalea sp.]
MSIEQYLKWQDFEGNEFRPVSLVGVQLLNDRILNKGTAFSLEERSAFHLEGLVPPRVQTFEDQLARVYQGYTNVEDDIQKYIFLRSLQDRNETLFYALVAQHVEEMAPIIYTPTVGRACQEFSHRYQKARGLYITPENVDSMESMVHHFPSQDIKIIVVTDSQGILGIGDQGIGGMGIPIGKLSLYTLGAGIHPACCLPIALDLGTNNEKLLNDPMYLGIPKKRIVGEEYDQFIEKFVSQIKRHFPKALLQWEDFSKSNAFNNLHKYVDELPSFNDDIQGTGSVVLAGIINGVKIKGEKISDQTYLVYGAGAGGVGVADQIRGGLMREGLTINEAQDKIFILDSKGLVFEDRVNLEDYKKPYAKSPSIAARWDVSEVGKASLTEVINNVPVTVLLGTSGVGSSFKEEHIGKMLSYTDRPIVFPLSNPTSSCEALPEDLYKWSNGKAIVATGSPFSDVSCNGQVFRIGQGNNVFIFPGVGLAAILTKTKTVPVDMFTTASFALADCVAEEDLKMGTVFPRIRDLRKISLYVAVEVIKEEIKKDSEHELHAKDLTEYVAACMWKPTYLPYRRV